MYQEFAMSQDTKVLDLALFEPPRWRNGPKICIAANLPAFDTEAELKKFFDDAPRVKVKSEYQCEVCKCWHAKTSGIVKG